jgi:anti-sigma regulatory factor (Ser/Thr protein kinase)
VAIASGARQDRLELITVVLGEAVNNVVEHAYGASHGTVHAKAMVDSQTLVLQIEDSGKWRPERAEKRGHGLRLMKMLVDTVGVDTGPSGTIVRLRADLSGGTEEPKPLCRGTPPLP